MTFKHLQKSEKKAEHARLNSYGFHEGSLGTQTCKTSEHILNLRQVTKYY